jgi:hypothetical protein
MWQQKILTGKFTKALLIVLLLVDFAYTFKQNASLPLDGDIAPIIVPDPHYADVLKDPFGFKLLKEERQYAASNRYFSHATMIAYFKHVQQTFAPIFKDKIQMLYWMSGFLNTAVQILMLFLLTVYITGHLKFWQNEFLGIALFISCFFQTHGMYSSIGIIDNSITYTFFYAIPLALLLLYFLPFYLSFYHRKSIQDYFPKILWPIWILLAVYLAFSGSIIAPLVLICFPLVIFWMLITGESGFKFGYLLQLPKSFLFFGGFLSLLCVYSFYIGTFNIESQTDVGIVQRYIFLLKGLPQFFFHKITFVVIGILLVVNFLLLFQNEDLKLPPKSKKLLFFIGGICILYIFLLPLGGYRTYRPWIIRYDTFMPISLLLIFLMGMSVKKIVGHQIRTERFQPLYSIFISGIMLFFTLSDSPQFYLNDCQNHALHQIEQSKESIIALSDDCTVLRWEMIKHPEHSKIVGETLQLWGITENPILFYQE